MIYIIAYFVIGVALAALNPWLSRKYSTPIERMLRISEDCSRMLETKRNPHGERFSDYSARLVGESVALIVTVSVWPVLAINMVRRIKRYRDLPVEDRIVERKLFTDR